MSLFGKVSIWKRKFPDDNSILPYYNNWKNNIWMECSNFQNAIPSQLCQPARYWGSTKKYSTWIQLCDLLSITCNMYKSSAIIIMLKTWNHHSLVYLKIGQNPSTFQLFSGLLVSPKRKQNIDPRKFRMPNFSTELDFKWSSDYRKSVAFSEQITIFVSN